VWIMNPKQSTQKVVTGIISGVEGEAKFHFVDIPDKWFKIDIREALLLETALMYVNEPADQYLVGDIVGTTSIWDQRYIKKASQRTIFYASFCLNRMYRSGFLL
jgi:hypothetical protein